MQLIKESDQLQLQIIATGAHLSPEFGLTYKNISDSFMSSENKMFSVLHSNKTLSVISPKNWLDNNDGNG